MNEKLFLKISSEIFTYLKQSSNDENDNNITFQQLIADIIGKKDDLICNKIKVLKNTMTHDDFMQLINQKDKQYTLLMLAASNNLIKTVKELLINGADTTQTIKVKGDQLKKILKYKEKYENIDEEQLWQLKSLKEYDASAIDIAKSKGYKKIVEILE